MYTKEQASAIRQKFWTSFGKYMSPVPNANFEKINWINYKTGIKGIFIKMDADKNSAAVFIEIYLPDTMLQHQYFEVFTKFAKQFEEHVGEGWIIEKDHENENFQSVSRICIKKENVNIFNESDWPAIISFLKKNIIAVDSFWNEFKPAFEIL